MTLIPRFRRFFSLDRGAADVERMVDDELRFHFDMTVKDLIARGMGAADARREAERRFGDVERTRDGLERIDHERIARTRRLEWLSGVGQDLRYAARGLRLTPAFAAGVVLTLGLGIGANATMFGIVDQLLFRPPAYLADAGRVHRIYLTRTFDGKETAHGNFEYRRYLDLVSGTTSFSDAAGFWNATFAVGTGEQSAEMLIGAVTGTFWHIFTARPVIGRFFTPDEDRTPDGASVAVLGYGFWQTKFGGRSDALGSQLRIGSRAYTIIGVAPEGFFGTAPTPPAAFVPITGIGAAISPRTPSSYFTKYNMRWMEMVMRRKPGVSIAAATADLDKAYLRSYEQQRAEQPQTPPSAVTRPHAIVASILRERGPRQGKDSKIATWLIAVSAIVLIIACANVGNLLLARALRRRREIAVRLALGISRRRLLAQLLTESVLLALLGGLAGVALAQWGGGVLRTMLLPGVTWTSTLADSRVLAFTAVVALVAGLLTGLAPAMQAGRSDVAAALKAGVREGTYHHSRLRSGLLVLQGALSVVLLVGAGLFVRSLHNVRSLRLGYDADRVLFVNSELRGTKLAPAERIALTRQLAEQGRAMPTVAGVSLVATVPFYMTNVEDLFVAGIDSVSKLGTFELQSVSPEYFATAGTRILRGRGIGSEDREHAPLTMVVSQSMAKRLWPGREALGQCVKVGADTVPCTTVVGVAEDIKSGTLADDPGYYYYLSIEQYGLEHAALFVRTRGEAAAQVETVRRALQHSMPGDAYVTVVSLDGLVDPERRPFQLGATMFAVFGALALLVAAVGLYSVIAYNVAQRMHEMGVRVALGARSSDVIRLVVSDAMRLTIIAVVIGSAAALAAGRWVAPLLYNTSPKDPAIFGGVVATLLGIAVVASIFPAVRAARVDPSVALRSD
ncbi:MAG: ABC transporter permease [Gemmatimonadaceae bacterium]